MKTKTLQIAVFILILVGIFFLHAIIYAGPLSVGAGGIRINKEVKSLKDMKTQNIVTQSLDYSCGPAAMATLLSYYFQDKVTEKQIINFLLLTGDLEKIKARKGFSLLDLKNFAKYRGYEVTGYKADLEFISQLNKPVLVPVNIKDYSHFVIFRGLKGNRVFLADPSLGKMTMRTDKFMKMWQSGIAFVLAKKGKEGINSPLKLSADEKAVAADESQILNVLAIDVLGKVHGQGEF